MAGVIQRFEQRLETVVTGAFARAFRSAVQPVEIAAALQREVDNSTHALSRDRLLASNVFLVELSPQDYARLSPFRDTLIDELGRLLDEHISEQRYTLTGPISIDFAEGPDLSTGRFHVSSSTSATVTASASVAQQPAVPVHDDALTSTGADLALGDVQTANVVVEVNGSQHAVPPNGLVIGRGSDADLRISDPGISRMHARIDVTQAGRIDVSITDLDSTNGVILNGRRVTSASVPDGSQIQLGNTRLVVRIGAPGS